MTADALAGLFALNVLYAAAGLAALWLLRGPSTWRDAVRLGGLAYLVGVAVVGASWTLLLVAGVPFSGWLVVATPLAVVCVAVLGGVRIGRRRPRAGSIPGNVGLLVAAAGAGATVVFLEALFRSARLHGLYAWDAWSFWVPKGMAI
ncbi:MAG: hypothetical protein NZL88_10180, partial [Gaiellaceae bacterium]|nr:hypothetical protein [Gaiellaceae bacterium]